MIVQQTASHAPLRRVFLRRSRAAISALRSVTTRHRPTLRCRFTGRIWWVIEHKCARLERCCGLYTRWGFIPKSAWIWQWTNTYLETVGVCEERKQTEWHWVECAGMCLKRAFLGRHIAHAWTDSKRPKSCLSKKLNKFSLCLSLFFIVWCL